MAEARRGADFIAAMAPDLRGPGEDFVFDATKPDGTPRKLLDTRRLAALGWRPRIGLRDGIRSVITWFEDSAAPA